MPRLSDEARAMLAELEADAAVQADSVLEQSDLDDAILTQLYGPAGRLSYTDEELAAMESDYYGQE
jgi:hypothetical protein